MDPFWTVAELSRAAVRTRSAYVRRDIPSSDIAWEWPLRIGLLHDEASQRLREAIEVFWAEHAWAVPLTRLVSVGRSEDCDLLLLPHPVEDALAAVLQAKTQIQSDCVLVLGASRLSPMRRWHMVTALHAAVRTSGVALVPAARSAPASWLLELVREISHAQPFDTALFAAQRSFQWRKAATPEAWENAGRGEAAPFLVAARALVEFTNLADSVARMAKRMESPELRNHTIQIPGETWALRFGLKGRRSAEEVGRAIRETATDIGYFREADMASVAAELSEAVASSLEPPPRDDSQTATQNPGAERYIQVQVFDASDPASPARLARTFRRGASHVAVIRVGNPDEDWLAPPRDARFPDEELPPGADEHMLTVVMTVARLLEEPLVGSIRLPRAGSSTEVHFPFFVPDEAERVDARILVMHANRVLQTARLSGPVGKRDGKIGVVVEARVRFDLSELAGRTRFDAALVLNNDPAGEPGITKAYEGHAEFSVSPDLDVVIDWIDRRLSRVAEERQTFEGGLASPGQEGLLRDLARKGSQLYRHVVGDGINDGPLVSGERIQVISLRPEARLPVELLYDRESPAPDAKICSAAAAALRAGRCAGCATVDDETVVCPFGFWGISKVLERHAHTAAFAGRYARDFVLLRTDPVARDNELDVLRAGVCGWTHRVPKCVTPKELGEITEALAGATGKPPVPSDSWDALQQAVADSNPSLILLLVHTTEDEGEIEQKAELGQGSWRIVSDIKRKYVRPRDTEPPPMVVMLGCESGAPKVDFLGFASQLRAAGAAVVVTANSTIHSLHAVPVAASMLRALRGLSGGTETRTLGEVMRTVRREMLAEGNLMVLCLSVYGDADWRLATRTRA